MSKRRTMGWALVGLILLALYNSKDDEPQAPPAPKPTVNEQAKVAPTTRPPQSREQPPRPLLVKPSAPVAPVQVSPPPVTPPPVVAEPSRFQRLYTTSNVRIRAAPSTSAAILWTAPAGNEVESVGQEGQWHQVKVGPYEVDPRGLPQQGSAGTTRDAAGTSGAVSEKRSRAAHRGAAQGSLRRQVRLPLRLDEEWPSMRRTIGIQPLWGELPAFVVNMEYYGKPIPAELPGKDVLDADELDVYERNFARTGFTPAINWYRNISQNWKAGLAVDQNVRVPALMISAEHDVVLRPNMAKGMRDHVPQLETHVIPDAWHWTPEEKPEEVNQLTIDWLQRHHPAR